MLKDLCFEIIEKCPNNCKFCSSCSSIDKERIIDFELFKRTIDHILTQGHIEEISLSGGEPFLHPDLFKMIHYCKSKKIRVVLFTSGIKKRQPIPTNNLTKYEIKIINQINNNPYSEITKEDFTNLEAAGLSKIVFDFQSSEVDTYNYLMGTKNQFTFVAKSLLNAGSSNLETDVHFIPLKTNYEQIPDIIELLNIAEIKNLSILNFVPQGRGFENQEYLTLSDEEMLEFVNYFNLSQTKFNGTIRIGIPLIKDDMHKCTAGLSKLVIKYDGTVLPCPAFKEFDLELLKKYGINPINIHDSLDKLKIHPGSRKEPLCKKLYRFNKNIK